MPAMQDGEIAKRDIAAILERNSFIADTGIFRFRLLFTAASAQAFAPDQTGTENRYVLNSFAPNQTVVPVTVPVILKFVPQVWLRWIILTGSAGFCCKNGRTLIQIKRDFVFQMNGETSISSSEEMDDAASRSRSCFNRLVDGGCIDGFAIAFCAQCPYVIDRGGLSTGRATLRVKCPKPLKGDQSRCDKSGGC